MIKILSKQQLLAELTAGQTPGQRRKAEKKVERLRRRINGQAAIAKRPVGPLRFTSRPQNWEGQLDMSKLAYK